MDEKIEKVADQEVTDKEPPKAHYYKHCEIVCDKDKLKVDLQKVFAKYSTIKLWAYILHDKDDTRPHYHIYLNFDGASVSDRLICDWFKVPPNMIERIKGRRTDMLLYLTHGNASAKHKHRYDPSEVVANFDFESEIQKAKIIGDFETYSYAQQLEFINGLPVEQKRTAFTQLKKLFEMNCECETLKAERNIQVVFITGKGGTGKTTYAKKMLDELGYDFSVSSSSNDPFQDYKGQRGIILDDLRDKTFGLDDLLRVLDNNTKSSIKSRFINKVFIGKMIVITSSVPLCYWYPKYKTANSVEGLYQLYRRINDYIEVTTENIRVYDGVDADGKPKGLKAEFPNDLIKSLKHEAPKKIDLSSVFAKICKPIEEKKENEECQEKKLSLGNI